MRVVLSKQANKQYTHLPKKEQKKVIKKLRSLEFNPLVGKKLSGELFGFRSLRAWPYRIIYIMNEKGNQIEIIDIEHRQSVYK